jgi:hypothetical protein
MQDQLVMDLKETIKALRQDMRSLAGALQQMSNGAPANNVLQTLPQASQQAPQPLRLGLAPSLMPIALCCCLFLVMGLFEPGLASAVAESAAWQA